MTIEELQKEKKQLEEQISNLLNEFQKKYKVLIPKIELMSDFNRTTNGVFQRNIQTYIDVKLF